MHPLRLRRRDVSGRRRVRRDDDHEDTDDEDDKQRSSSSTKTKTYDDDDDRLKSGVAKAPSTGATIATTPVDSTPTSISTVTKSPTALPTLLDQASRPSTTAVSQTIDKRPISETTQHLVIAAGSVAATIALTLIAYVIYRLSRGATLRSIFTTLPRRAPPPPKDDDTLLAWDRKPWNPSGSTLELTPPPPSRPRSHTSTSWPNPRGQSPSRSPFPPPNRAIFRTDAHERPGLSFPPPTRASLVASFSGFSDPPPPPPARDDPLPRTPPRGTSDLSVLMPLYGAASSPTILPSASPPLRAAASPPPSPAALPSRFSWTDSAAKTPVDGRFSRATERSSVARYRTGVESVYSAGTGVYPAGMGTPAVPAVPARFTSGGKRRTAQSEATVFRQHPGTEVVIPHGSRIPSEILDGKIVVRRSGGTGI
ncbi:hypothetical protein EJ06DRAFT_173958 [Trichodelitschia bisporula]|uniref:Uncharacterized protein n=1 Tax=Trichodelitschia bisporula TaxID=703511 RepID=A0A6G1HLS1_9PEZI|nr:hypothetical protein EJ06DRAFT_173958 [Trichodelitschia bisporula]